MAKIGSLLKVFALLCFSIINLAQAQELWTKTGPASRNYLSIEKSDAGIKLRHFYQEKGEYQNLLNSYVFKNKVDVEKYVAKNFPQYEAAKKLEFWPIDNTVNSVEDKAFGFGGGKGKGQPVWTAKNQWNNDWELKYSKWLQEEITPDFYKRYKIPTDCADALVGLRWIFARINSLPVANTVADTGNLFGNFSVKKEWRKYGTSANWYQDQLFMAALDYVMNLTSTRTVVNDGFPVRIDKEGLVAGTFIITQNNGSGHAKIITETHYEDLTELPLYTLASTSPRELRLLTREVLLDQDWPEKGTKEILAFRWPVIVNSNWVLQPKNARPTYSLEQFDEGLKQEFPAFIQFVLSRVKGSYDPLKLVEMGVSDILRYAEQRAQVVTKGYEQCKKMDCRPGTSGDDDWGTTSRDSKLLKKFHDIDTLVKEFENLSPGLYDRWIAGLGKANITIEGVNLKLSSLRFIMENNLFSSLGSDTPAKRWGLHAPELLTKWIGSVEQLLKNRNDIVARPENPCSTDCYPKTNLWTALSTYHVDAELNSLYVQISTYCTLIDINSCNNFFATKGQKTLSFNNETKSLESWFKVIPYFNSDPRVSIDRRWGNIPSDITARVLPYYDAIKVSKNSLALLDSTKLINLKDGKIIFEATGDSRVILTAAGKVYKINDSIGKIQRMTFLNGAIGWISIEDPDQILQLEKDRLVYVSENNGHTIFRKPLATGQILFRITDDKIEFIKEYSGATNHQGPLVTMALSKNTMSFVDLDKSINMDISVPLSSAFFDMGLMKISSYKYPHVILEYKDRDQDLYYPVLVDLEKKSWQKIAPSLNEKTIISWSNVGLKKIIIQSKFNQEFPALHAISWDESSNFTVTPLSNLFLGAQAIGETVYVIDGTGGVWDQNVKTRLIQWDKKLTSVSAPVNSEVKFLTSFGAYFSSDETGTLVMFGNTKNFKLPKDLLPQTEFCQMQTEAEEVFSYRFSTNYGDYSCMGGSLLKSHLTNQSFDTAPQFSQYSWINKESLLDQRWQKKFIEFDVEVGSLIGIGKNMGLWWGSN